MEISDPLLVHNSTVAQPSISSLARANPFHGRASANNNDDDDDDDQSGASLDQPTAFRCEDGGYEIDPSTISNSPARTFTRIDDLDPEERVGFRNQFQSKTGRGRMKTSGRRQLSFQRGWVRRDDFDELRGETFMCFVAI